MGEFVSDFTASLSLTDIVSLSENVEIDIRNQEGKK